MADPPAVPTFTAEVWIAFAGIGLFTVLTGLYALAALARDRTAVIDLKAQVLRLRREYEAQTAEVIMEEDEEVIRFAQEQADRRMAA